MSIFEFVHIFVLKLRFSRIVRAQIFSIYLGGEQSFLMLIILGTSVSPFGGNAPHCNTMIL
jgi:hypothetical protein